MSLTVTVLAAVFAALLIVPEWQVDRDLANGWIEPSARPRLADAYRQTILKVLGGLALAAGFYLTLLRIRVSQDTNRISEAARLSSEAANRETQRLSEQGQVTERFTRAIEQLGSEKTAIQLGGVYALERIMLDSPKDHATVMEVLAAFIRENADQKLNTIYDEDGIDWGDQYRVESVIQAALTSLGRRSVRPVEPVISLPNVWLRGYDFNKLHFEKSRMTGAHLEGAKMWSAHFQGSHLEECCLEKAQMGAIHLEGAHLRKSRLDQVMFIEPHLLNASFDSESISKTFFTLRVMVGARIDGIVYEAGMPDPRTEAWRSFVSAKEAEVDDDLPF